jgi:polyhydroxyalkanoate synthase
MAAMHGALQPDTLATLTLLAAPIDFSGSESLLNLWTDHRTFDVDAFIDAHGNCPAWFLQSCFQFMNPIRNFVDKAIAFWEQMDDPNSVVNHCALERWLNDNIPVAGATFREFVGKLYQRNELVRGEFVSAAGRRPAPHHLSAAAADRQNDHLVAPASTEASGRTSDRAT